MKFSDLMAKTAYSELVGSLTNNPPAELGVSKKLPVRPGTTIKTPTGLTHYSGNPPDDETPDEEILEWLDRLNIREAADDPKFNSMLNKITKSNDLQKYDKMMFGITEPVTHSKEVHGNTFFVIGDELLDWLENLLTDMPPEMKERLTASYEDDTGNIGDWISQNTGIPMKILRDIHHEIANRDGYNITEFFYCISVEEFNQYFRQPWEQYKSENM